MSISIHHGPNGSYKTAGVINDYFIPAARAGRVVVTNIRGCSRARTFLEMPDIPDTFDVIYVDTDTREGRYQIATWFHWAPVGAMLLFDESGVMFPKAWVKKDIDALNYPGGTDAAGRDGRPSNWIEAWEMHRHYNWDIVLTAPNIKSIRDDIRQTTEGAYKHKNKALLGPMFSGYKEGYHDAQKSGQSATDFDVIRNKRVDPLAFRLYDSTKTGKAQQTLNGFNLFTSPRVVLTLGTAALAFGYSFLNGGMEFWFRDHSSPETFETVSTVAVSSVPSGIPQPVSVSPDSLVVPAVSDPAPGTVSRSDVVNRSDNKAGYIAVGPLTGAQLWISGSIKSGDRYHYVFTFLINGLPADYTSGDLVQMGYRLNAFGTCSAELLYKTEQFPVSCVALQVQEAAASLSTPAIGPSALM